MPHCCLHKSILIQGNRYGGAVPKGMNIRYPFLAESEVVDVRSVNDLIILKEEV
jgi:hypothetical protein